MRYLLFCTPRSGSDFIAHILSQYFIKKYNYKNYLDEYLNYKLYAQTYYYITDGITKLSNKKIPDSYSLYFDYRNGKIKEVIDFKNIYYDNKSNEDVVAKHFELLKSQNELYFLKLFGKDLLLPDINDISLKQEIFDYFNDNYTFICLERTHKFDQFMSWCVACHTQQWASLGKKIDISKDSICVEKSYLDSFKKHIIAYEDLLPKIKNKLFYTYEEFTALEAPIYIISALGFEPDDIKIKPHTKINTTNAWDYVKNKEEVLEWIKDLHYTSIYQDK